MKTAGIICEYNPFHNGHLYQLQKTREAGADAVIAVMSGNFVQRGDVSIVPKQAKVQMAIDAGVDLVLELPTVWAMSPAQNFAKGAVSILKNSGVCDLLSFGSECADITLLKQAALATADSRVDARIGELLKEGSSFVAARSQAVREIYGPQIEAVLTSPNDILGIEYLKALEDSSMEPLTIPRSTAHDGSSDDPFLKSASQIRESLLQQDISFKSAVPQSSFDILREYVALGQCPMSLERLNTAVLSVLRKMEAEDFLQYCDVAEGLENKLHTAVMQSSSINEILMRAKSKRYTLARMRRIVLEAYLGIEKGLSNQDVPYLRVLGMNEVGKSLLSEMQQKATKPIISKYARVKEADTFAQHIFAIESRAADLYTLGYRKPSPCGTEMTYALYVKN